MAKKQAASPNVPREASDYINGLIGRSIGTIRNYESLVNSLWGFLGHPKRIVEVTPEDIIAFLKDGLANKGWKPSTASQYARLTRAFMYEFRDEAFMKKLKKQLRSLPKSQAHANLLLGLYVPPDKIDRFIASALSEEWAVFYTLMFKWGLRVSEALSVSPSDIDAAKNRVLVRGKGMGGMGKIRQVLVEKSTITRALQFAGCDPEQVQGEKIIRDSKPIIKTIKPRNAEYKFKETAKKIGLKNWKQLHPHSARHSYSVDFLLKRKNQGMAALLLLKNQLGHTNIAVTQIYLELAGTEAQTIFDAVVQDSNMNSAK